MVVCETFWLPVLHLCALRRICAACPAKASVVFLDADRIVGTRQQKPLVALTIAAYRRHSCLNYAASAIGL